MLTGFNKMRSTRFQWLGAGLLALSLVAAVPMDAMADKTKDQTAARRAASRAAHQEASRQKAERTRAAKAAQEAKRAAQREAQREAQARAAANREAAQQAARAKRQAEEAAKRQRAQSKREAELARKAAAAKPVSNRSRGAARSSGHDHDDHDDHNHGNTRQRADDHPLTVLEKYGKDRNGDGKHDHLDHHVNNPIKAAQHNHLAHHPNVRQAIKRGSSNHSNHNNHNHSKNRYDHRDRYDRDRYDNDRSRFSFGILFGDRYSTSHHRCSHGYTRTSCHICNPRYGYSNRARVYVRPEPVVIERRTTVYEQPPVVVTPPPAPAPAPEPAIQYVNGWQLLRAKDPAGALKAFEDAIARDPNAGIHRIGCSIAGALLGDDDKAVLAMRDVVRFAPGSMIEAPVDGEIVGYYASLIDKYQTREDTELARVDDAFMIAAVSYLKRDFALAHASVRTAQRLGDTDVTVGQLGKMVEYQRTYQRKP